jgi:outer membrane protein assembly factor BamB
LRGDGTQKWEFLTGDAIHSSPALGKDGTIYFGGLDRKLYAINPTAPKSGV